MNNFPDIRDILTFEVLLSLIGLRIAFLSQICQQSLCGHKLTYQNIGHNKIYTPKELIDIIRELSRGLSKTVCRSCVNNRVSSKNCKSPTDHFPFFNQG